MKKTERMMVALDLSFMDITLLRYADYFAKLVDTKQLNSVHIIPVIMIANSVKIELGHFLRPAAPALGLMEAHLEQMTRENVNTTVLEVQTAIVEGRPYQELIRLTEEAHTDLLVLGSKRVSSGSGITAKRAARHVNSDLLMVPEASKPEIKRILVAMDFSENAARALAKAQVLSAGLATPNKITCIYVLNPSPSLLNKENPISAFNIIGKLPEEVEHELKLFKTLYQVDDKKVQFQFLQSSDTNIAKTIKAYAKSVEADLIVLGAKGHNVAERFLFGSVAEGMVDGFLEKVIYIVR